jgi:RNA polymerase-binding transcription factor DksA
MEDAMTTSLIDRKAQLQSRRAMLDRRLHGIDAELDSHQSRDWEDLAIEREEDEVLEGIGAQGLVEIRMIDEALKRLDDGTYGICATCGEAILPERLDVLPYTPVCRNCVKG